jgi:hypothetical protein
MTETLFSIHICCDQHPGLSILRSGPRLTYPVLGFTSLCRSSATGRTLHLLASDEFKGQLEPLLAFKSRYFFDIGTPTIDAFDHMLHDELAKEALHYTRALGTSSTSSFVFENREYIWRVIQIDYYTKGLELRFGHDGSEEGNEKELAIWRPADSNSYGDGTELKGDLWCGVPDYLMSELAVQRWRAVVCMMLFVAWEEIEGGLSKVGGGDRD